MIKRNILLSTTRQWNPGDEFILYGIINVLKEVIGDFNPVIYNRNPDIRPCDLKYNKSLRVPYDAKKEHACFKGQGFILSHFRDRFCDNSFRDGMGGEFIDYVIFAGTPEWEGARVRSLYRYINEYDLKHSFMGIGYGGGKITGTEMYKSVWGTAELITARDKYTAHLMKEYHARYLPCPALLSSQTSKCVKEVKRVALVYSISNTHVGNRVSEATEGFLHELYRQVLKKYDCTFICHYIDELEDIRKKYPDSEVRYSFNSQDYFQIYGEFDLVIGARVHAIGICASMGIPGIMITHDARSTTVDGFLAEKVNMKTLTINEVMHLVETTIENIEEKSGSLEEHKRLTRCIYVDLLNKKTTLI